MNLSETFRVALQSLTSNKMRSALTMLGMIIGVGAVIALMAVGQGAQASVDTQIQGMGTNLLFITPGATQSGGVRSAAGTAPTLTLEDAQAIAAPGAVPEVVDAAPESDSFGQVIVGGNNVNTRIAGVTPDYENVRNWHVSDGQFITQEQVDGKSLVALLGSNVAAELFPDGNAVGQTITVGVGNNQRLRFQVVGVLESKGAQALGNQDDQMLIPITTLQQKVQVQRTSSGGHNVNTINVQLTSSDKHRDELGRPGDRRPAGPAPSRRSGRLHDPQPGRHAGHGQPDHRGDDAAAGRPSPASPWWSAASGS